MVNNLHCLSVQPLFTPLKVVSSHEQPAPKHPNWWNPLSKFENQGILGQIKKGGKNLLFLHKSRKCVNDHFRIIPNIFDCVRLLYDFAFFFVFFIPFYNQVYLTGWEYMKIFLGKYNRSGTHRNSCPLQYIFIT